jgi:tetratricopeptide (TPR) repeat protein
MRLETRIKTLWHVLAADSPRGAEARRRALAMAAMAVFLLALLATIGLFWIALLVLGLAALGAAVVAVVLVIRRYAPPVAERGGTVGARAVEVVGASEAATRRAASQLGRLASRAGTDARTTIHARIPEIQGRYARAHDAVGKQLAIFVDEARRQLRSATANAPVPEPDEGWPARPSIDDQRQALRANAAGSQLRRDGAYAEAAEQHRAALELFRSMGDRRAEALTLNNLALALDRSGDPAALDLFEEAATILGELGEDQHEGQVIANLALAFRRRGREQQSAEVLEIALGKLNPDSQAYRKLEELRRAS